MPKVTSFSSTAHQSYTITVILSLSEIILSLYSCYAKKGLVYIALASLSSQQPSSCSECTKANIRSSCDVRSISDTKCARPITFNSHLVPLLIYLRVLYSICCCET